MPHKSYTLASLNNMVASVSSLQWPEKLIKQYDDDEENKKRFVVVVVVVAAV